MLVTSSIIPFLKILGASHQAWAPGSPQSKSGAADTDNIFNLLFDTFCMSQATTLQ